MNRRSFFTKLALGLASLPFVGKLFGAPEKDAPKWGMNIAPRSDKVHTRPGIRLCKFQLPPTAHSPMFWSDNLWWLDSQYPATVFCKPISEISGGARGETVMWSKLQDPAKFS